MKMTCLNYRGLQYIAFHTSELFADNLKVIVVSEHWLWPYVVHRLGDIHPE